jgi:hypothetical protein
LPFNGTHGPAQPSPQTIPVEFLHKSFPLL